MELIRIPRIIQDTCKKHLLKGRSVGFVATMGALHDGHFSLIKRSKMENDITAASIFVNPAQFGPGEDFEKYPRDIDGDTKKLREIDIDILFIPDKTHMYPTGFSTQLNMGGLSERLCGNFRPGHFNGVATVVAKLLNIVSPTRAYFGQKDFQQTVVIKRMVKDLNFDTEVVVCPTIREQDGLAMSSRNMYLDKEQRKAAGAIYRALAQAEEFIMAGERLPAGITGLMNRALSSEPLITGIDYASVFNPQTLEPVEEIKGEVLLSVAARLGDVRLIDNLIVNV